jgi:hypothetical protein
MEAFADLQHCYNLLGTSHLQSITSAETRNGELNLTLVRGNYHFNEIKRRRTNFFCDTNDKATEKDPIINNGGDEDDETSKISKPPKHIVRGQFGSSDAELMVQRSRVKSVDQATKAEKMTGSEQHYKDGEEDGFSGNKGDMKIASGPVIALTDNEVRDERVESSVTEVEKCPNVITDDQSDIALHEDRVRGSSSEDVFEKTSIYLQNEKVLQSNRIGSETNGKITDNDKDGNENVRRTKNESKKQDTISEANSRENTCDPELNDAVLVSEESEKRNEGELNDHGLQADAILYDKNTTKDVERENPAGGDSETERQSQRMAALEYVINATLAHIAYFSESNQEAYDLAKCIEHT